jgi:hypothetical protein
MVIILAYDVRSVRLSIERLGYRLIARAVLMMMALSLAGDNS